VLAWCFIPSTGFLPSRRPHVAGDVSTGVFYPIVPKKIRKYIFFHFHNISHPGRLSSRHIVSSRFVWIGLASDITAWSRACLHCQLAKHACSPGQSPSRINVFLIFTSIWWDPYSIVVVFTLFSLTLTLIKMAKRQNVLVDFKQ
jgi:hypothetical protein